MPNLQEQIDRLQLELETKRQELQINELQIEIDSLDNGDPKFMFSIDDIDYTSKTGIGIVRTLVNVIGAQLVYDDRISFRNTFVDGIKVAVPLVIRGRDGIEELLLKWKESMLYTSLTDSDIEGDVHMYSNMSEEKIKDICYKLADMYNVELVVVND